MADVLKTFIEGEDILASETNSNNLYLLSKITDNASQLQEYIEGEIETIKTNFASVQATLQNNINELKALVEADMKARVFVEKIETVSKGTTDLSNYLPDDGNQYQVWVSATYSATSTSAGLSVQTDLMTEARRLLRLDGDAGRSSGASAFAVVPVGAGRSITFTGSSTSIVLCGFAKL